MSIRATARAVVRAIRKKPALLWDLGKIFPFRPKPRGPGRPKKPKG
jgi:hypothetical protein